MSDAPGSPQRRRPQLSLKGRALRFLSRREHSRLELQRKLAPHAESPEALERVLDELEAARLLSNQRFAESLVHRKADRFGSALIRHELRTHAVEPALVERQVSELEKSELSRARALGQRRFGAPPDSAQARARQIRFLMSRGFRADVVRRVVVGRFDPDEAEPLDPVDDPFDPTG